MRQWVLIRFTALRQGRQGYPFREILIRVWDKLRRFVVPTSATACATVPTRQQDRWGAITEADLLQLYEEAC